MVVLLSFDCVVLENSVAFVSETHRERDMERERGAGRIFYLAVVGQVHYRILCP